MAIPLGCYGRAFVSMTRISSLPKQGVSMSSASTEFVKRAFHRLIVCALLPRCLGCSARCDYDVAHLGIAGRNARPKLSVPRPRNSASGRRFDRRFCYRIDCGIGASWSQRLRKISAALGDSSQSRLRLVVLSGFNSVQTANFEVGQFGTSGNVVNIAVLKFSRAAARLGFTNP